jgi:hypothetical protein
VTSRSTDPRRAGRHGDAGLTVVEVVMAVAVVALAVYGQQAQPKAPVLLK